LIAYGVPASKFGRRSSCPWSIWIADSVHK
jgi:hypothetical protein